MSSTQLVPTGPAAVTYPDARPAPLATDHLLAKRAADVDYARLLAEADLLPPAYRRKPANLLLAMSTADDYGLTLSQALNGTHVINNRAELKAQLVRALIVKAGHRFRIVEVTDDGVVAECSRAGDREATLVEYRYAEAEAAGLPDRNPNWRTQRRAMLVARVTSRAAGELFPDVLWGMPVEGDTEVVTASLIPAVFPAVELEAGPDASVTVLREHIEAAKAEAAKVPVEEPGPLDHDLVVAAEAAALDEAPVEEPSVATERKTSDADKARELLELVRGASTLDELRAVNDDANRLGLTEQKVGRPPLLLRRHIATRYTELNGGQS